MGISIIIAIFEFAWKQRKLAVDDEVIQYFFYGEYLYIQPLPKLILYVRIPLHLHHGQK